MQQVLKYGGKMTKKEERECKYTIQSYTEQNNINIYNLFYDSKIQQDFKRKIRRFNAN